MGQSKPFGSVAVVVEDDPIQREILASLLEEQYDVIQCEDAETAALALAKRHPSLLVTDVNLEGAMTGLELAEKARRLDSGIKVIVISGSPAPQLPEGIAFFTKPFHAHDLLREAGVPTHAGRGAAH